MVRTALPAKNPSQLGGVGRANRGIPSNATHCVTAGRSDFLIQLEPLAVVALSRTTMRDDGHFELVSIVEMTVALAPSYCDSV